MSKVRRNNFLTKEKIIQMEIKSIQKSDHMQEHFSSSFHYCAYLKGIFRNLHWDEKYLEQVLLRRGFLVRLTEEGILYSSGNTKEDFNFLRKFSNSEDFANPNECKSFPYKINFNSFKKERIDEMLFSAVSPGFGLTFREPEDPIKDFKKHTFGFRLDLVPLDIGISAFVKALSIASVKTCHSCDGHDDKDPEIELLNEIHFGWFNYLVSNFFQKNNVFKDFKISNSVGRYGGILVRFRARSQQNRLDVFEDLFQASNLIRNHWGVGEIERLKIYFLEQKNSSQGRFYA
jgi:hypothetical protein